MMESQRPIALWLTLAALFIHAVGTGWNLGVRPLWVDEACSALFARSSAPQIIHTLREDCGMPLHYVLLTGVRSLLGESEAALRAPSVLFSVLTGLLIWWLGRRLAGDWAGFFGVLLWIGSPSVIRMAREARCYTLFAFLTTALFIAWHLWVEKPCARRLIPPILLHTALAYLHNFGLFLFPAAFAMVLWEKGRKGIMPLLGVTAASFVLYLPWVSVLFGQLEQTRESIGWVARTWSPFSPIRSLGLFCYAAFRPVYLGLPSVSEWLSVMGIAVVVWPVLMLLRSRRKYSNLLPVLIFAAIYLLTPYVISWLFRPIELPGRTDFPIFPLLCVVVGCGVVELKFQPPPNLPQTSGEENKRVCSVFSPKIGGDTEGVENLITHTPPTFCRPVKIGEESGGVDMGTQPLSRLSWLWAGIAALLAGAWLLAFVSPERGYNDRETAALIERWTDTDDVVICTGLTRPSMEYYLYKGGKEGPALISFPDTTRLGYLEESVYLGDAALLKKQREKLIARVRESSAEGSPNAKILVILTPRRINDGLIEFLADAGFGQPRELPTGRVGLSRIGEPCRLVLLEGR